MSSILGADFNVSIMKTYFLHPETQEEIFVILDAHAMSSNCSAML
jgi:hypothetical protein